MAEHNYLDDYIRRGGVLSDLFGDYRDIEVVERYPAADVKPVVHGKWKSKDLDNFRKYEVICSECGARYVGNYDAYDEPYDFNFCPHCGADMREQEHESKFYDFLYEEGGDGLR